MNKKLVKQILLVGVIAGLLAAGGYYGYRSYQKLQQDLLIKQASDFLAKSDFKNTSLCLNRALRHNPGDLDAIRLMADLAEKVGSPDAVAWRKKLVAYRPDSLDDRLALVKTSLKMRDLALATKTLDGVDQAGKKTAAYHNEAGAVDVAERQFTQAEAQFLEAARLEPTNPVPLLNVAILRLGRTNVTEAEEGRSFLQGMATNTTNSLLRRKALFELISDARRFRQTNSALALSKTLLQETNGAFEDKLVRLDVLADTGNSEFKKALDSTQRDAADDPTKIYALATWENRRMPPADLLAWLKSLPTATLTNRVVALLTAEAYSNSKDWRGLQTFLQPLNWTDFECVRYAFQARALEGQQLTERARAKWADARTEAGDHKQALAMLLELTIKWRWATEQENILRDIIQRYPSEQWAFQQLAQLLFATGRTWPLLELFGKESQSDPSDLSIKNNLAWVALLVNSESWKPYDLAKEVYLKSPTNSHYASTYAFSLHLQHKDSQALKILEKVNPAELETPSMACGYGLVLNATGNRAKAKKYLEIASRAPMLPEQRKLIEDASTGL